MNLFVYGSLQVPAIMARVTGRRHRFNKASLNHHQRYEVLGQTYPGMVSESGNTVDGMLYHDIAEDEWPALDAFESEYERVSVAVMTDKGQELAQTYRYLDKHNLSSKIWRTETFLSAGIKPFMRDFVAKHCANPTLILGSSSKYRQAQLKSLGLTFDIYKPEIDETPHTGETPKNTCLRLAINKAMAVPGDVLALVIGSDQVLDLDGEAVSKPGDYANALVQLKRCQGKTLTVYSALCLRNTADDSYEASVIPTHIRYRDLPETELIAYLRHEQPYDCAGSIKSEASGMTLLASVTSDDPSALIGLPLIALTDMLRAQGYRFF